MRYIHFILVPCLVAGRVLAVKSVFCFVIFRYGNIICSASKERIYLLNRNEAKAKRTCLWNESVCIGWLDCPHE